MKALIIDDEPAIRLALAHFLTSRGYEVQQAATGAEGLALARSSLPELVFLDRLLPDMDGDQLLHPLSSHEIGACVVMMSAYIEFDKAVQAMKKGAEYYFPKPLDLEQVAQILERLEGRLQLQFEAEHFRTLDTQHPACDQIIGESLPIIKLRRLIALLAENRNTPVLILGESGTGKELVARGIHALSGVDGPLVELNCASLTESLLESELFGHERGAFTDARATKAGLFEIAGNGTIFFDELAEMPLPIQAKLLKVLDTKMFRRVGGVADIRNSARFMAATNRDIAARVRKGLFREDLFYRINVLPLTIAPLRERGRDVQLLADYFAALIGKNMGKGRISVSDEAMGHLLAYDWPGNVRELKNIIERALILTHGGLIMPDQLPLEIRQVQPVAAADVQPESDLKPLWQVEEDYIDNVLRITGNNHSRTAAILGISRSTLLARLKKRQV
jgi:DNA-binding NtrC family response regulator